MAFFDAPGDVTPLLKPLHGILGQLTELNRLTRISMGLELGDIPEGPLEGIGGSIATDESTWEQEQADERAKAAR